MRLFTVGAIGLAVGSVGLLILVAGHVLGLFGMLACMFLVVSSNGFMTPNAMALALNDFPHAAGGASALRHLSSLRVLRQALIFRRRVRARHLARAMGERVCVHQADAREDSLVEWMPLSFRRGYCMKSGEPRRCRQSRRVASSAIRTPNACIASISDENAESAVASITVS
jgi:hypothetical protein